MVDPLLTIHLSFFTVDQLVNGCKKTGPSREANVFPLLNLMSKQKKSKMLIEGHMQVLALG